jgi:hypothetical protein
VYSITGYAKDGTFTANEIQRIRTSMSDQELRDVILKTISNLKPDKGVALARYFENRNYPRYSPSKPWGSGF